jgi:hypothetical protein
MKKHEGLRPSPLFHYSNTPIFQMKYSILPILQKIRFRDNGVPKKAEKLGLELRAFLCYVKT